MKTGLMTKVDSLSKERLYVFSKLPYDKIFILYNWEIKLDFKVNSKIVITKYDNLNDLLKKIDLILDSNLEYRILPSFTWDDNSKYAIRVYNKTFWTKVDPKIFKEKDKMSEFLWSIIEKKYIKFFYKDLIEKTYEEIKYILWETFIIKPTNAFSSMSTFKVLDEESFQNAISKISKSYDFVVEEYIMWDLMTLDFFCDWENIFLLSYAREVAMIELFDKNKFSEEFLKKYSEEITKYFNFILPFRYNLDFWKISKLQLEFIEKIRKKLVSINYRWVIHLEYKYDFKNQKIGFIEWWARYGWYRKIFIKQLYHTDVLRLSNYILNEKDFSRFNTLKDNIYKFKEKETNLNFVWVKTNFIKTTNFVTLLKKSGNILENSLHSFIQKYYFQAFWIKVKKIDFFVKYSWDYNFYPFYKNNKTKFDYILELDDENFTLFKKRKFKIIEKVFFHNY